MQTVSDRLDFALQMSDEAARLILKYFRADGLLVESKSDDSPVTVADRGAEQLMRERLATTFPDDAVLGEEFPNVPGRSGYRWIIDPIDGTKAFIHGIPLFGTLIGIEFDGRMVAGVCRLPALDEVVFASEGDGCWWQIGAAAAKRTRVTNVSTLAESRLMFTEPTHWTTTGRFDAITGLMNQTKIARGWGDCCGHVLVATGRAEIAVDPLMSPWDIAALIPILREAGGHCTDWKGAETTTGGDGVSTNAALHETVIRQLSAAPPLPRSM